MAKLEIKQYLVDVSDLFSFFCSGEGKGESDAPGRECMSWHIGSCLRLVFDGRAMLADMTHRRQFSAQTIHFLFRSWLARNLRRAKYPIKTTIECHQKRDGPLGRDS